MSEGAHSRSSLTNPVPTLGAAYPVLLPVFEGPLDLLLHLILREELDISEVSLVAVTEQYLITLSHLEELEPGALADFLVVASQLLYLKSSKLLPKPETPDDDAEEGTVDLIAQLVAYRQFKSAASTLRTFEERRWRVFVRPEESAPQPTADRPLDLSNLDLTKLRASLQRVLDRIPATTPTHRVTPYPYTVADRIDYVRSALRKAVDERGNALRFTELLGEPPTRAEAIVTFLAVLELVKQQEVTVAQDATFGDITLSFVLQDGLAISAAQPEQRSSE